MAYLLLVDSKGLFHIGDFRRANWESLDLAGGQSAEVAHRFHVSCSNKLPKTTGPMETDFSKRSSSKISFVKEKVATTNKYISLDSPHVGRNLRQHDFDGCGAANQGGVDAVLGDRPWLLAHFRNLGGEVTTTIGPGISEVSPTGCKMILIICVLS